MKQYQTVTEILPYYTRILFDAYGVLVTSSGVLPGANEILHQIRTAGKTFQIITNDASKPPEVAIERYGEHGLELSPEEILSSGMLVTDYLLNTTPKIQSAIAFGTELSSLFLERADVNVEPLRIDSKAEALILLDDSVTGNLKKELDTLISFLVRRYRQGTLPTIILANPDLLFPKSKAEFGLAVGGVAIIVERILELLSYGRETPKIIKLGKPYLPIYEKAIGSHDKSQILMIGDQLATDIRGARNAGVDSGLILTGVTEEVPSLDGEIVPEFVFEGLVYGGSLP